MGEVELAAPGQRFELESPPAEHLLGDEPLLAQALWNALSYATVINENKHPIGIHLERSGSRVELEVVVDAPMTSQEEIERAFAPFTSFHYEGDATMRNVMGLFLCHEIARVHGGSLGARTASETKRSLVIDLPG
jgi:K+-sensing histidine kinase KdpD